MNDHVFFSKIVRREMFGGEIGFGEELTLARHPNKYDPRAVAVCGRGGRHFGFLPRKDAGLLFDFLQPQMLTAKGRIVSADNLALPVALRIEIDCGKDFDLTDFEYDVPPPGAKRDPDESRPFHVSVCAVFNADIEAGIVSNSLENWCRVMRPVFEKIELPCSSQLLFRIMSDRPKERHYEEEQERRRKEAAHERRQRFYQAFACEAGTEFLPYGSLRLLPLKAMKGVSVRTLPEALEKGELAFPTAHSAGRHSNGFIVDTEAPILGVRGASIRTTKGTYAVYREGYILQPNDGYYSESEFKGKFDYQEDAKVFVSGADHANPEMPVLPADATGFALFWGDELIAVRLFGTHTPAVEALGFLAGFDWHVGHGAVTLTPAKAAAEVRRVLGGVYPFGDEACEAYFGHQPGLVGGSENRCRIDREGRLMNIYLRLQGFSFRPCDPKADALRLLDENG